MSPERQCQALGCLGVHWGGMVLRESLGVIAREHPELHQSLLSAGRAAGSPVVGGTKATKELPFL